MAAVIKIEVTQSGGIDKLKSDVESIGASAEKSGGGFSAMGEIATGALRHIGEIAVNVAGAAISKFTEVIGDSISAARESNMVAAQTAQVIKSTGSAAGVTAQHVLDYASALSAASGKSLFGDEQIAESTNLLLTFTEIKGKTLDAATAISVDMAQALGGAPKDAAIQLGKALNDPVKGITALTRVGVTFSAEQKATIQAMQEAGDTAGAQAIILKELNKEFGGSAAAAAAADGGFAQFHDRLGEMEETIGKAILPILGQLMGVLNDTLLPIVENVANVFSGLMSDFSEGGIGVLADDIREMTGIDIMPLVNGIQSLADAFGVGASDGGGLAGGITNAIYSLDTISPVFDVIGDAVVNLTGAFQEAGPFSSEFGEAIGGVLSDLGLAAPIVDIVEQAIFGLQGAIQSILATFTDAPTPIEGFLNVLGEVSPTFAFVRATIEGVMPAIQVTVTTVLGVIGQFWKANGADIMATVQSTWATIKQIIDVALPLIQGIISGVLAVIVGFIRDHGKTIQQVLGDTWNIIKNLIQGALAIIQGVLTAALAIFRGDWSGAWEAIKTMSVTVTLALGNIVKSFLDIIAGYFGTSLSEIGTLWAHNWEQIKNYVANIDWGQLGADVVNGIISGISGASGDLADAARHAAMDAYNAAKNALGISSPSTVMAEGVGVPIVTGIMAGIQDTIPGLVNLIDDLGTQVVEANRKWKPDVVKSFRDTINAIDDEIEKLGTSISNTINDAFLGAASLDRAKARAIDTLKDIGAAQQANVQAQLAGADEIASKMSDPAAAAKYFKMRSDQIFELAKLQSQLVEGTDPATKAAQLAALQSAENAQLTNRANRMGTETAGIHALFDPQIKAVQDQAALTADQMASNQRIQDQIALITDAQKNEMAGAAKASVSPASALIMQLSDLKMKADDAVNHTLPGDFDGNPVINALRALTNQLSMLTSGGNSSTVTSSNSVFNYAPTITTSAAVTPAPAATMRALANV